MLAPAAVKHSAPTEYVETFHLAARTTNAESA